MFEEEKQGKLKVYQRKLIPPGYVFSVQFTWVVEIQIQKNLTIFQKTKSLGQSLNHEKSKEDNPKSASDRQQHLLL